MKRIKKAATAFISPEKTQAPGSSVLNGSHVSAPDQPVLWGGGGGVCWAAGTQALRDRGRRRGLDDRQPTRWVGAPLGEDSGGFSRLACGGHGGEVGKTSGDIVQMFRRCHAQETDLH